MRRIRIVVTAILMAALACGLAARPLGASANSPVLSVGHHRSDDSPTQTSGIHANTVTGPAYDIDAYNYYCTGGGFTCVSNNAPDVSYCGFVGFSCPGLNYADAESYGPYDGSTSGTPKEVFVECTRFTASGVQDIGGQYVTSDSTYDATADLGVIGGKSTLIDWYPAAYFYGPEGNPAQVSSQMFTVFDPSAGFRGSVTGIQNTNNEDYQGNSDVSDTLNSGLTTITLTGWINTYTNYGLPTPGPGGYFGTLSCQAGGPHAYDLINAGYQDPFSNTFEGELEGGTV